MELQGYSYSCCHHAAQRWKERFSGINIEKEFSSCNRVGKKQLKLIKSLSPKSSKEYLSGEFKGRYCLLSRSNIVFVIQGDVVITCFHLYGD